MDTEIFKNMEINIPDDAIITTEAEAMEILSFKNTSKKFCDVNFSDKVVLNSNNSSLDDDAILTKVE